MNLLQELTSKYSDSHESAIRLSMLLLTRKHNVNFFFYIAKSVNEIVMGIKGRESSRYSENKIFDDEEERLKRVYGRREGKDSLRKLTQVDSWKSDLTTLLFFPPKTLLDVLEKRKKRMRIFRKEEKSNPSRITHYETFLVESLANGHMNQSESELAKEESITQDDSLEVDFGFLLREEVKRGNGKSKNTKISIGNELKVKGIQANINVIKFPISQRHETPSKLQFKISTSRSPQIKSKVIIPSPREMKLNDIDRFLPYFVKTPISSNAMSFRSPTSFAKGKDQKKKKENGAETDRPILRRPSPYKMIPSFNFSTEKSINLRKINSNKKLQIPNSSTSPSNLQSKPKKTNEVSELIKNVVRKRIVNLALNYHTKTTSTRLYQN